MVSIQSKLRITVSHNWTASLEAKDSVYSRSMDSESSVDLNTRCLSDSGWNAELENDFDGIVTCLFCYIQTTPQASGMRQITVVAFFQCTLAFGSVPESRAGRSHPVWSRFYEMKNQQAMKMFGQSSSLQDNRRVRANTPQTAGDAEKQRYAK